MTRTQHQGRQVVSATASTLSGGHGIRTRNRFPGTTFPVSPLAIRLPSGKSGRMEGTQRRPGWFTRAIFWLKRIIPCGDVPSGHVISAASAAADYC
jgi:hypothetical protein